MAERRTETEIYDLKEEWKSDPCWDIEDTKGFSEHRQELLLYRFHMENQWRKESQSELRDYARKIGTGSLDLARTIKDMYEIIELLSIRISELENEKHG